MITVTNSTKHNNDNASMIESGLKKIGIALPTYEKAERVDVLTGDEFATKFAELAAEGVDPTKDKNLREDFTRMAMVERGRGATATELVTSRNRLQAILDDRKRILTEVEERFNTALEDAQAWIGQTGGYDVYDTTGVPARNAEVAVAHVRHSAQVVDSIVSQWRMIVEPLTSPAGSLMRWPFVLYTSPTIEQLENEGVRRGELASRRKIGVADALRFGWGVELLMDGSEVKSRAASYEGHHARAEAQRLNDLGSSSAARSIFGASTMAGEIGGDIGPSTIDFFG
ncbi:MAG: hypothetical protein L0K44_00255 [Yaniella sp.]|nr:hypothetical protein [Yaniella sp.]